MSLLSRGGFMQGGGPSQQMSGNLNRPNQMMQGGSGGNMQAGGAFNRRY